MEAKKLKISPDEVRNIGIIICIFFTIFLGIVATFNYYKYSETLKRFKQKNGRLLTLEKDCKDLHALIQQYREERTRLREILFSDRDIATFLDRISSFSNDAKVNIKDMQAQKFQEIKSQDELSAGLRPIRNTAGEKAEKAGPTLSALPINMTVEAEFGRLIDFLISLEKYRQLLTLSNVSIKRKEYPTLDCKFILRLYSLKELGELGK